MANFARKLRFPLLNQIHWQIFAGPILILLILSMLVLPLPAWILDALFTFNIVLSLMILLVSMFNQKTLEFSAFPTILLFSTLLRLALNIASTRIILLQGHTGHAAAGRIVEAFGHFLVGGNFAIGIVVFIILIIINFMVITKGAGRIAEVGARFALDGMPGKQMAIDADLNAGLIGENEARQRRQDVTQEAEFYGSMDGASKFVRGDAIAGLLIMAINLTGGLLVGVLQQGMPVDQACETYTLLTIGDGLVAQIPALIISTAAGVIVTRVSSEQDVGEQMISQLLMNPRVITLSAAVIGIMGIIPGMPHLIFLSFMFLLLFFAWWLRGHDLESAALSQNSSAPENAGPSISYPESSDISWSDVSIENLLTLEVGYRLIPMVDKNQNGQLLTRLLGIRKKCAREMGFLLPPIHIHDNLELEAAAYRILLKGVEIGTGEIYPEHWMAINPGFIEQELDAIACKEPAFGLPAYWIEESLREKAQNYNYTVVDTNSVIATHLNHLINIHMEELFSREDAQMMLDKISQEMPKLIEDIIPGIVSLTLFHKVLRNLLSEHISLRDMRTITGVMAEYGASHSDADQLTTLVRQRLGPAITQQWLPGHDPCEVIGLDYALESLLIQSVQNNQPPEPKVVDTLLSQTEEAIRVQSIAGLKIVLVVNPLLRLTLARILRRAYPQLAVLSSMEISFKRKIKYTTIIGKIPVS